MVEYNRLCK